jgi:hypothetical protein
MQSRVFQRHPKILLESHPVEREYHGHHRFCLDDRAADGDRQRHAKGRIVSVLEGGYDLDGLARSLAACGRADGPVRGYNAPAKRRAPMMISPMTSPAAARIAPASQKPVAKHAIIKAATTSPTTAQTHRGTLGSLSLRVFFCSSVAGPSFCTGFLSAHFCASSSSSLSYSPFSR